MATQEEIVLLLEQLRKAPPSGGFKNIDRSTAGLHAVLRYLYETQETVTAGKISEKMGISTARVAVLLKKMAAKGLIEKEKDASDGRLVVVQISETGKAYAKKIKDNIYAQLSVMIDKIGMERMLEFAQISREIHELMERPLIDYDL